ncbi:MAG: hypothetical protein WBW31_19115 [Candidatus Sulfotelmatobacter sp.]
MSTVEQLAMANGLALVRQKKHKVFRDSQGRTFVISSTPSDKRWVHNAISTLAKVLGKKKDELTPKDLPRERVKLEPVEYIPPAAPRLTRKERLARRKENEARQDAERRERNLLKRLEKDMTSTERHAANKARQVAARERFAMERRRYELQDCAYLANLALADYGTEQQVGVALGLVHELKQRGYDSEVVLMVRIGTDCVSESGVRSIPAVRCGPQYIDIYTATVYDTPTWQDQNGDAIEALVSLKDLAKEAAAGK